MKHICIYFCESEDWAELNCILYLWISPLQNVNQGWSFILNLNWGKIHLQTHLIVVNT